MEELEKEEEEQVGAGGADAPASTNVNDPKKTSNDATLNGNAEGQASREEEEVDPNALSLDPELLCAALKLFHTTRENNMVNDLMNQKTKKSKDSKSTDKARDASREKKKAKLYWARMTEILSEQKLSVWKALDKALGEYYQLLVDRQNLIEETGLLNQQNEELKTLLNQYLQAGVNQELQVPPTQVIRLDI